MIELFSLGAFVLSQFTHLTDRQTDRQTLITIPRCMQLQRGKNAQLVDQQCHTPVTSDPTVYTVRVGE